MACFLNRIKIFLLVECLLCVLLWAAVLEATHRIRHRNGKIPYFFFNIHQRKTQFENAVYDDRVCMCVCKNGLPCNLDLCAVLICRLSVHGKTVQTANAVFMPWLKLSPPPGPYVRWTPGLITALSASTCTQTSGSGWAFWLAARLGRLP